MSTELTRMMVARHGLVAICHCEDCVRVFEEMVIAELREQIAREIEAQHSALCQYQVQHFSEQGYNNFTPIRVETFDKCSHLKDAAKARGTNE